MNSEWGSEREQWREVGAAVEVREAREVREVGELREREGAKQAKALASQPLLRLRPLHPMQPDRDRIGLSAWPMERVADCATIASLRLLIFFCLSATQSHKNQTLNRKAQ